MPHLCDDAVEPLGVWCCRYMLIVLRGQRRCVLGPAGEQERQSMRQGRYPEMPCGGVSAGADSVVSVSRPVAPRAQVTSKRRHRITQLLRRAGFRKSEPPGPRAVADSNKHQALEADALTAR